MTHKFFILFLLGLFFSPLFSQNLSVIKITDLDTRLKNGGDTLFIVNFWATWCAPCVKEIPDFIKAEEAFRAKGQKVKLLLVSLDDVEDKELVADFKAEREIRQEILLLNESNANYWIPFIEETWEGAIPVSLFWQKSSNFREFVGTSMHFEEVEAVVRKAVK
ncbi:MAG: TlpA disulfide reductase family protein [Bacteroidia bacterium]